MGRRRSRCSEIAIVRPSVGTGPRELAQAAAGFVPRRRALRRLSLAPLTRRPVSNRLRRLGRPGCGVWSCGESAITQQRYSIGCRRRACDIDDHMDERIGCTDSCHTASVWSCDCLVELAHVLLFALPLDGHNRIWNNEHHRRTPTQHLQRP